MMRLESYQDIDFSSLSRKERRQLLNKVRDSQVKKTPKFYQRSAAVEAACDRAIGEIRDTTGETISRALATRVISGVRTQINGKWLRGASSGEVFSAAKKLDSSQILDRFARLAGAARLKAANVSK
ncbi:hypothetical protein [Chimaeribacter arupi]|uniref:hypothetical protein n=1 Tax=Chimaeribacter arupi TaxID=2060066 RepID=UPI000C7CA4C7|nr:hypothetical protein [Chimaeribacter arupi]PLR52071.1 hypothetical protein CYR52_08305 [Chimaeribacter arupi]